MRKVVEVMRHGVVKRGPPDRLNIRPSVQLEGEHALGRAGFSARVRELREAADISLREQDRLSGLTLGHSQAIDKNKIAGGIEAHVVARIARIYGSTIDWLYLGHGSPPTPVARESALDRADQVCRREEEYRAKIRKL